MKKGTKVFIGCGTALIFGALILLLGLYGLGILTKKVYPDVDLGKARKEGTEFGSGADQNGCMAEGYEQARTLSPIDLGGLVLSTEFVSSCLDSAAPVDGFCDGVPGLMGDLTGASDKWKRAECGKHNISMNTGCRQIAEEKLRYCQFKIFAR